MIVRNKFGSFVQAEHLDTGTDYWLIDFRVDPTKVMAVKYIADHSWYVFVIVRTQDGRIIRNCPRDLLFTLNLGQKMKQATGKVACSSAGELCCEHNPDTCS